MVARLRWAGAHNDYLTSLIIAGIDSLQACHEHLA